MNTPKAIAQEIIASKLDDVVDYLSENYIYSELSSSQQVKVKDQVEKLSQRIYKLLGV